MQKLERWLVDKSCMGKDSYSDINLTNSIKIVINFLHKSKVFETHLPTSLNPFIEKQFPKSQKVRQELCEYLLENKLKDSTVIHCKQRAPMRVAHDPVK